MPPSLRVPVFAEECDRVVPGFARVDHDGLFRVARDLHLLDEDVALDFARREVVMIVEADFAERDHFGVLGQSRRDAGTFRRWLSLASCGWTPTVA